jgi:hypothetical protein
MERLPGAQQAQETSVLSSLIESDDFLPSLARIVQCGPVQQALYESRLDQLVIEKEAQIEDLCTSQYTHFIASVTQTNGLKDHALQLRSRVVGLNKRLQESGERLAAEIKEVERMKVIRANIQQAVAALHSCIAVLRLCSRAADQVEAGKLYAALRSIDKLQRGTAESASHYQFSKLIGVRSEEIKSGILRKVTREFNDWLYSARDHAEEIGRNALASTKRIMAEEAQMLLGGSKEAALSAFSTTTITNSSGGDGGGAMGSETASLSFSPVYQCIYTYEALGIIARFRSYYKENRRKQARLVCDLETHKGPFLAVYQGYLAQIVGFFVIECVVLRSTQGLISTAEVDTTWDEVHLALAKAFERELRGVSDDITLLEVKYNTMLAVQTLAQYGFSTTRITEVVERVAEAYERLLRERYRAFFDDVLREERYDSLVVNSADEWRAQILAYSLQAAGEPDDPPASFFPRTMPFSQTVPRICRLVTMFINDFYKYIHDMVEDDDVMRRATDVMLEECVIQAYLDFMTNSPATGIAQAVQIALNAQYLAQSCGWFESYAAKLNNSRMAIRRMRAKEGFGTVQKRAQDALYELLDNKTLEFMSALRTQSMAPSEPNSSVSECLVELTDYLRIYFDLFKVLPADVVQSLHYTTCKRMARIVVDLLADPSVKRFNTTGVSNLELDLLFLEKYARSCGVRELERVFAPARQLFSLLQSDEIEQYLDPRVRNERYSLVDPQQLVSILEKYEDHPSLLNNIKGMMVIIKSRKKVIQSLSKALQEEIKRRK